MRDPAAMAERLARPSPCDWPWSGVYKPLSQYHRPPRLIGSDGSAHQEIQILALILSRVLSDRPPEYGEKKSWFFVSDTVSFAQLTKEIEAPINHSWSLTERKINILMW